MRLSLQLYQQVLKHCTFCETPFYLIESTAFIWAQDGSKKDIRIGPNVIREKSKLLYDNLKQKEGEGSKAGEFSSSRRWFDIHKYAWSKEQRNSNDLGTAGIEDFGPALCGACEEDVGEDEQ